MRQKLTTTRFPRLALAMLIAVAGFGLNVAIAPTAHAAIPHLTATSVSCPGSTTYGTPATCTVEVRDLALIGKRNPTGTVGIGTILNRLDVAGSPCTLSPTTTGRSTCSVTVTPTDTGHIVPIATYTPSGDFIFSIGLGVTYASPAPLTITADPQSMTYGATVPTLTATYAGLVLGDTAADLDGTLLCSTPATSTTDVGTAAITCSGQSSDHYAITYIGGTLTIDPAALTVTADSTSRTYGAGNPTFTVDYAGFVLGQGPEVLGGALDCTTTAATDSPVGAYPITCGGQTATNYGLTWVDGTLTVDAAALTITADAAARVTGQANPTFSVSYDGFVAGDTPADLSGTLACTTSAGVASPAGTYAISCSGLASPDYEISWVDASLAVLAAPTGTVLPSSTLEPGGDLDVDGTGWTPDSLVTVIVCGIEVGVATADSDGVVDASFPLPSDLPIGDCELVLSGTDSAGQPYELVLGISITAPAPPAPDTPVPPAVAVVTAGGLLPYTGGPISGLVLAGLVVLVTGAGLNALQRRRAV